jgi:hypothetical protein
VGARIVGSSAHLFVVNLRIYLTLAVIVLAVIGLRRHAKSRSLELLAIFPFLLVVGQSYGGEVLIRCFLYSLPFLSLLAAGGIERLAGTVSHGASALGYRIWRRRAVRPRQSTAAWSIVAATIVLALAGALAVARGGNDPYTANTPAERQAVLAVYSHARPGERVGSFSFYLPMADQDVGALRYVEADDSNAATPADATTYLLSQRPQWIILSHSQERWGELVMNWQPGWEPAAMRALVASGYRVFRAWPGAVVLTSTAAGHAPTVSAAARALSESG